MVSINGAADFSLRGGKVDRSSAEGALIEARAQGAERRGGRERVSPPMQCPLPRP